MNPPLHYTKPPRLEPLFLQKLLQAIHIQMEMSLRRREQRPEIPGQLPSWNSTISMICQSHLMFEKTKAWSLWNITKSWLNEVEIQQEFQTALDLHKSTCHVQSTEWLQWKGSADALGAVFLAVFPPLPEHLWVSCIRTPPAQRCSSTRRSNSNLEK